jgi:hypothetical protein
VASDKLSFGLRAASIDDVISYVRVAHARDFPTAPPVQTHTHTHRHTRTQAHCV